MPLVRQEWTWHRSLERLALARLCQAGDLAMAARVCSHTGAVAKTGSWCLFDPEPLCIIYMYTYIMHKCTGAAYGTCLVANWLLLHQSPFKLERLQVDFGLRARVQELEACHSLLIAEAAPRLQFNARLLGPENLPLGVLWMLREQFFECLFFSAR